MRLIGQIREQMRALSRRATGQNANVERVWNSSARPTPDSVLLRMPSGGHPPIQVLDPESPDFGKPYFVLGLDEIGGGSVLR